MRHAADSPAGPATRTETPPYKEIRSTKMHAEPVEQCTLSLSTNAP